MGSTVRFSREDLLELRALRARLTAALRPPDVLPWGWSTGWVDPGLALAVVPGFSLRPGFRLWAAHYRGAEGSGGVLWAFPDGVAAPVVDGWDDHDPSDPPAVDGACADFMQAIDAEGKPWNLMCASILQRELAELGGQGGYRKWGKHDLISVNPWRRLSPDQARENRRHFTEGQYWMEEMLEDLRPRVELDDARARVVFYTAHRRYHLPVYVHEDEFDLDGLGFTPGRRLVGRVPYKKPAWAGDLDDPEL